MIPAPCYNEIEKLLNEESDKSGDGSALKLHQDIRTVGFILFDQNFKRDPIKDVASNLDMLNRYSGKYIHFFLCGVSKYGKKEAGARKLGKLDGGTLYHNAGAALSFADAFGREIPNWKYDQDFHLFLVDVVENENRRKLDFTSAIFSMLII